MTWRRAPEAPEAPHPFHRCEMTRAPRDLHHRGESAHCERLGQHRLHGPSWRSDSELPERAGQPHRGLQRAARIRWNIRTGSHNVVVGKRHNFSRFGGLVVGFFNTISGDFAVVSGGVDNTASGDFAAVSGGSTNTASGSGLGQRRGVNTASGDRVGQRGVRQHGQRRRRRGQRREATRPAATAPRSAAGVGNTASGALAAVSGGASNTASGRSSGQRRGSAPRQRGSGNTASGRQCRRSAAGRILPKRRSSAGRRVRKLMRSWWATFAPRSLPREGVRLGRRQPLRRRVRPGAHQCPPDGARRPEAGGIPQKPTYRGYGEAAPLLQPLSV